MEGWEKGRRKGGGIRRVAKYQKERRKFGGGKGGKWQKERCESSRGKGVKLTEGKMGNFQRDGWKNCKMAEGR